MWLLFIDKALKEIIKVNDAFRLGSGQYHSCPNRNRRFGHRHMSTEERPWRCLSPSTSKEINLGRNQPCWHLDLGLLAFRSGEKINFCYLSSSVCGILVSPSKLKQYPRGEKKQQQHIITQRNMYVLLSIFFFFCHSWHLEADLIFPQKGMIYINCGWYGYTTG